MSKVKTIETPVLPNVVMPNDIRILDSLTLYDDGTRMYLISNRNPLRVDRAPVELLMHAATEVIEKETGKILKHRYAKRVVQ